MHTLWQLFLSWARCGTLAEGNLDPHRARRRPRRVKVIVCILLACSLLALSCMNPLMNESPNEGFVQKSAFKFLKTRARRPPGQIRERSDRGPIEVRLRSD